MIVDSASTSATERWIDCWPGLAETGSTRSMRIRAPWERRPTVGKARAAGGRDGEERGCGLSHSLGQREAEAAVPEMQPGRWEAGQNHPLPGRHRSERVDWSREPFSCVFIWRIGNGQQQNQQANDNERRWFGSTATSFWAVDGTRLKRRKKQEPGGLTRGEEEEQKAGSSKP
jgi:hypothetical protein